MPRTRLERFTPSALRIGDEACPRWLDAQLRAVFVEGEPFARWNIRYALLPKLLDAHAGGHAPTATEVERPPKAALLAEEYWHYEHFVQTYCDVFANEPGASVVHGCERPNDIKGVSIGGAVDLLLHLPDGTRQLRQLELWGREVVEDPASSWELGLAILRLHRSGGVRGELEICHADLNRGIVARSRIDMDRSATDVIERLGVRIRDLRSRASSPVAIPGACCSMCQRIPGCPSWDGHPPVPPLRPSDSTRYVGRVVQLTPTSAQTWLECPRKWRARHVVGLPGWPTGERARLGLDVHEALARLHADGPCNGDPDRLVLAATDDNGEVNEAVLDHLKRHAVRCPQNAVGISHEESLAEMVSDRTTAVMLTARIDAIWEHDGILDCRDYKTGKQVIENLSEDLGAQIQAVILTRAAATRGLTLRLRHEYLSSSTTDDPPTWEPDDDDLDLALGRILRIGADVASSDFAGVADPSECRRCPYWRACPESAADEASDDYVITAVDPDDLDIW